MTEDKFAFIDKELEELRETGLYNEIRTLESSQGPWVVIKGERVLNLCSNNYLGLADHDRLQKAAKEAIDEFGVGPGAVRTIAGTMTIHEELEEKLADFKGTEATLVLQSGFNANTATIPALVGRGDTIYSDALNHASIIDGCRLSGADIKVFEHNDMESLEETLQEDANGKKIIITDGVFSMDGDLANLPRIVELAEEYGCMTMVDDAHGEGVLGENGRGIVDHYDLHGEVDIEIGTLSKAFGCVGGFVAGSAELIEFLEQKARPFLFSTGLTPMVVAANIAAVEILRESDELVEKLWDNSDYFKAEMDKMGFDTGKSETPITPVIIGKADKSSEFSRRLLEENIFAQSIGFPTVPKGTARIRVMISAAHSREDLEFALDKFEKIGKELDII